MQVTGLDVSRVEIMLMHRVVLLSTLLISVVCNLLLAEASVGGVSMSPPIFTIVFSK